MMRAANNAAIRSAIGLGQTDAPTFAGTSIQSQTDGAHTFKVRNIAGADLITINTSTRNVTLAGDAFNFSTSTGNFSSYNAGAIAWSDGSTATGGTLDLFIRRDAAGILAQRNGTAAQAFRVYNTYDTAGANYDRLSFFHAGGQATIATEGFGTNAASSHLTLAAGGTTRSIFFQTAGSAKWLINSAGNFLAQTDNLYDIGASGANRPRNIYAGTSVISTSFNDGTGGLSLDNSGCKIKESTWFYWAGRSLMSSPASGLILLQNTAATDFGRLQLGGITDAFPAIARDGAGIKFTGAAGGSTSWIKVPPVAVASLPAAATAGAGARAFVNDALAPVFGSAVASGGTVNVPVYSNGTNWFVG